MRHIGLRFLVLASVIGGASTALGQSFGIELHNTLMPASGGMGGVSIARPQDLTSAINANPAALTQFRGTQFMFGGGWAEPTFRMTQTSDIPVVGANPLIEQFSAKSNAPGTPVGNIGVTQDLSELGLPATFGIGFITTAGGFVDYRQVPESHGTNTGQTIFNMPFALGLDLTDRLAVGASLSLGIAFFDGPFVGVGGMTAAYALRGTIGGNYLLTEATTFGAYYQTAQSYTFNNAFLLNPGPTQTAIDVNMDLPPNIGFGVANNSLMDGRLLLGVDVIYKLWDDAALYQAVYDNQWVVQLGGQLTHGRYRLRAGYVWAENPIDNTPGSNIGGVVQPGDLAAVRYTQGLLAITSQHRISFGVGVVDVLPGIDLDLMAGGMFRDTAQLGNFTTTSIEGYWIGAGMTWRLGRGACCGTSAARFVVRRFVRPMARPTESSPYSLALLFRCAASSFLMSSGRQLRPVHLDRQLVELGGEGERRLVVGVVHAGQRVGADVEALVPLQDHRQRAAPSSWSATSLPSTLSVPVPGRPRPLMLLKASVPTPRPSYLKSNSSVCLPGASASGPSHLMRFRSIRFQRNTGLPLSR